MTYSQCTARPLRVNHAGGWYHVMNRGIERRDIFLGDRERGHFVELIGLLLERYGIEVHAFCLMENHYHLAVRTPLGTHAFNDVVRTYDNYLRLTKLELKYGSGVTQAVDYLYDANTGRLSQISSEGETIDCIGAENGWALPG